MEFQKYTIEEAKELVDSTLKDIVLQEDARQRMTGLFIASVLEKKKCFPALYSLRPDTPILSQIYQKGDYDNLVRWGDGFLLLTGLFPEWASKKRKASLGLGHYIGLGIHSYDSAVNLKNEGRAKTRGTDPGLVNYFSNHFIELAGGYFRLRERLNQSGHHIGYELAREIRDTFGYIPELSDKIIVITGIAKGNKKNISSFSKGIIMDKKDLTNVPIEVLVGEESKVTSQEKKPYQTNPGKPRPDYLRVVK